MNKKISSTFIALTAFLLLAVAGAVYAYFSITATSTSNVFSTGKMNLVVSDDDEVKLNSVTQSWIGKDLVPGSILPEKKIDIFNNGTIDGHHINLIFSYTGSQDLAKNLIFTTVNHGFRYGGAIDSESVNLNTALRGFTDTDYIVKRPTGQTFTSTSVDGADGTVPDGRISLSELAIFGRIRIEPGTQFGGIKAGTSHSLWLNAEIGTGLTEQNTSLDMKITFELEQTPDHM